MASTKRKVSLTKQLLAANKAIVLKDAEIAMLAKDLKSKTSSLDTYYKLHSEVTAEIEQVHSLIDALPSAIGRKSEPKEYGATTTYNLMTRLAAWLAMRAAA